MSKFLGTSKGSTARPIYIPKNIYQKTGKVINQGAKYSSKTVGRKQENKSKEVRRQVMRRNKDKDRK